MKLTTAAILLLILGSCVSRPGDPGAEKARQMGASRADKVIAVAADSVLLQDALLETQARITRISDQYSPSTADAYRQGFEARVAQRSDSLARILGL